MDKRAHAMKVKINGEERNWKGKNNRKKGKKVEEAEKPDIPVTSWNEKAMAEQEAAASNAEKEDEFTWVLPEDDGEVFQDDPKVVAVKKVSSKSKHSPYFSTGKKVHLSAYPFKQYAITIVLAIVLGVSFGFLALNFMSDEDLPAALQTGAGQAEGEAAAPEAAGGDAGAGAAEQTIQLYFAQIGKFSSKEGADATAADLKAKGFPAAAVEEDGSYFVYGGVGNEKQEADGLSNVYKSSSIDTWSGKTADFSVKSNEDASAFIGHFKTLVTLSSAAVEGNGKEVKSKSEAVLSELGKLKPKDESLVSMKKELTDVSSLLAEGADEKTGWAAQQKLMDLLVSLN